MTSKAVFWPLYVHARICMFASSNPHGPEHAYTKGHVTHSDLFIKPGDRDSFKRVSFGVFLTPEGKQAH